MVFLHAIFSLHSEGPSPRMPRFFPQGHWLYLYIHVWSLPVLSSGTAAPCPRLWGWKTSSGYLCEYSTWCYPVEGVWLSSWRRSSQSGGPPGVSGSQSGPPGPPGLSQAHPGFPVRPGPAERSWGSLLLRGSLQLGQLFAPWPQSCQFSVWSWSLAVRVEGDFPVPRRQNCMLAEGVGAEASPRTEAGELRGTLILRETGLRTETLD